MIQIVGAMILLLLAHILPSLEDGSLLKDLLAFFNRTSVKILHHLVMNHALITGRLVPAKNFNSLLG